MKLSGYIVESVIAESPMAIVYKVRHPTLHSIHACKLVSNTIRDIPTVRAMFLQKMQWKIEHQSPFSIRVTDVLEDRDNLGMIMDWLEGENLETHLKRFQQIDIVPTIRFAVQVLSALHVLHLDGEVHLDVSPQNIFLHRTEKGHMAILMDDGIHRHVVHENLQIPQSIRQMYYASPEEIHQQHPVGTWTDVYRLGVVMYRMLVGRLPFSGDSIYSVMHAIQGGRYQSIQQACPDAPPELIQIIEKAMSLEPKQRFANAQEMLKAIQSALAFEIPTPFEPVTLSVQDVVAEPIVDVMIEEDGEWVLHSSNPTVVEEDSEESIAFREASTTGSKRSFQWSPWMWRNRYRFVSVIVLSSIIVVLWLGGLFDGRHSIVSISAVPDWGATKGSVDELPIVKQQHTGKLTLGEHAVEVTGGVSVSGGCGRCCWGTTERFDVPFGWGQFETTIDLGAVVEDLSCPTIEQNYGFEKIDIRQGWMGAPPDMPMRADNSLWHQVQLVSAFWMGKTEVTQQLYGQVMNVNQLSDGMLPKREVSWDEAILFCNRLSELEGLEQCYQTVGDLVAWEKGTACEGYRLPTEAEWELAARANSPLIIDEKYHWFAGGSNGSLLAWYAHNSGQKVHPVGGKYPNMLGLYDMSGNVSEWVWDGYSPYLKDAINPKGVESSKKVIRGGHFLSPKTQIRVFDRGYASRSYRSDRIGFRIVRSIQP